MKNPSFNLRIYFLVASLAISLASVLTFRSLTTSFLSWPAALLVGIAVGTVCFSPLVIFINKLLSSTLEFARNKAAISVEIKFPTELRKLAESLKDLTSKTVSTATELQRQDSTRRELLANAAHDIKGPLSAISGYLEQAMKQIESGDIENLKLSLGICTKNTQHLQRIVLEIFEAAKFDNLSGNLALEVTSIDELISDTVQKFSVQALKEGKILSFKPANKNALVQIDLGLIERAISNLLDNALKYVPSGGQVTIGSKLEDTRVLIYVSDNGRGIPEKDLPHIFDRLYRVEKDRSKESKGSGFGLAIVKKIVEAHSGQIYCSSTVGAGTVFQIFLPTLPEKKVTEAMAQMISKKH